MARFDEAADIMMRALRRLGIDARVGEVPGEYCPGQHSVNARGRRKLMGVGQRLIRGAAHVGGVVVVSGGDRIRDVLIPVYDALGVDWRPQTVGSVERELGVADYDAAAQAILRRVQCAIRTLRWRAVSRDPAPRRRTGAGTPRALIPRAHCRHYKSIV